jgi:thioredoxin 1/putative thioredoxin
MGILNVTEATFERDVLRSELPVLIDFHADWCAPCKQIAPIVEEIAREHEGKLTVAKIDIDKNQRIATAFRVQSIPMLVVMAEGQVVTHQMGAVDKPTLMKMLEPVLPRSANELKPAELAGMIAQKSVVPIDVRDAGAFQRYRIPTALNVPAAEVITRAAELAPRDGRLRVLYARSGDEAKALAEQLLANGVQVAFLAGGFLHWEADGLEVEKGAN